MSGTHDHNTRVKWVHNNVVTYGVPNTDATKRISVVSSLSLLADRDSLDVRETAESYVSMIAKAIFVEWYEADVVVVLHTDSKESFVRVHVHDLIEDEPYREEEEVRSQVRAIVAGIWDRGRWVVEKCSRVTQVNA